MRLGTDMLRAAIHHAVFDLPDDRGGIASGSDTACVSGAVGGEQLVSNAPRLETFR